MTESRAADVAAMPVSADSEDPRFNQPYIDVRHTSSLDRGVSSQREGDPGTPFARSFNLGRVRVVVHE